MMIYLVQTLGSPASEAHDGISDLYYMFNYSNDTADTVIRALSKKAAVTQAKTVPIVTEKTKTLEPFLQAQATHRKSQNASQTLRYPASSYTYNCQGFSVRKVVGDSELQM